MLIYKVTNLINKKFYIGQEKNFNPSYLGSGILISKAIKKYGIENFIKEILENGISTKQILDEREIFWIEFLDAKNFGYNIASGGQGGNFLSQELMDLRGIKISNTKKGKYLSEDHKKHIKEAFNTCKKEKIDTPWSREKNGFYKKTHTEKVKNNIRNAKRNVTPGNAISIIDEDGIIYKSALEAAKQFPNIETARRAVLDVCRGRRDSFRGKIFKFLAK